jgi:hypothetical protein
MHRTTVAVLSGCLAVAASTGLAHSARAQTGASVSPRAVGPAAPTATPIGGLRTRPIGGSSVGATAATIAPGRRPDGLRWPRVADAPRQNAGVVVDEGDARDWRGPAVVWTPTADAPHWRRDEAVRQVDAWRDLIVTDVVCSSVTGSCRERQQRVRAPWIARCGCYAFADGWNRRWRVE